MRAPLKINLVSLFLCLLLFSCKEKTPEKKAPTEPPVALKMVVHETLLEPYEKLIAAFQKSIEQQQRVTLERTTLGGYSDAEQIAIGEQKSDLWVTPSLFTPEWVNKNLLNLGARQIGCKSYGSTPLEVITTLDLVTRVCDQEAGCLWEALANYMSEPPEESEKVFQRTLLITPPLRNPIDSIAWSNLFHWEGVDVFRPFGDQPKAKEVRWNQLDFLVLPEYKGIFNRIAFAEPEEQYIVVAPDSALLEYKRKNPSAESERLIALPLKEIESFTAEFGVCSSSGDWVTAEKRAVVQKLEAFLGGNEARRILESFGYHRTVTTSSEDPKKSAEGKEALTNPKISITNPSIRKFVSESWKEMRPRAALTIAMDTSASLEEEGRIYDAKRVTRLLVAAEPDDSTIAFMTFSGKPSIKSKFGTPRKKILKEINDAAPLGGSAVYDAFVAAFELTETAPEESMKRLLFITDGGDINSRLQKDQILLMAKRRAEWRGIDLLVVGLKTKAGKLDSVKEIAKAANGRYIEIESQHLDVLLPTLTSE